MSGYDTCTSGRVVVGVSGSLGSVTALCRAAAEWQQTARERLLDVLDQVFGDARPDLVLHGMVVRATPGLALVETADREDDILVVGAGRRGWHRPFSGRVTRYCLTHAHCPVLAVPPSPLEDTLASAHRRNSWHLPLDVRQLSS
ncbi:universal stress protein [Streptomyces sp. NPDC047061]|uniref:universal stress protein n=1 Tax=Streptomyces sp. NPDC047061 TaxID=3154605 RepID=UPI0033D03F1B